MKNPLVYVAIAALVFVFCVGAGTLGLGVLFYMAARVPAPPLPPESAESRVTVEALTRPLATAPGEFPPPPSQDGSKVEHWDGYYYYSLDPFEEALKNEITCVHFWCETKRTVGGSFSAACDESSGMGESRFDGTINREEGTVAFSKQYTGGATWRYEGRWVPERGRIEGTYGPRQGSFVLYPRALSPAEIARFERANAPEFQPKTPPAPKKEEQRVF